MMQEEVSVRITVNGQQRQLPEGTSVSGLLELLQIRTRAVAVERNLEIVPRVAHPECILSDGDRLEIVTLVGGG
jgi:sulfur carrier protein